MRSRVNLVHFKGVQSDPDETYMMKLTCCTWDCLLENGAHSRHMMQIGMYFILRYNWHMDVPWNISKIFYWISFFFLFNTRFDIELYDILYNILCKLYILWIGVLDWHIHCARVWYEIIKIVEHSLVFHLGSCNRFDEVGNVSGNFFYRYKILFWNFEIWAISIFWKDVFIFYKNCLDYWIVYTFLLILFSFLALVDDTPRLKNKHQISLNLGLKKNGQNFADNIFKWIFL